MTPILGTVSVVLCKTISGACYSACLTRREIIVALTRLSLSLGNHYKMKDEEFSAVLKSLGLSCREGYFEELRHVIIQRINISFTINTFENFVATHSILIHLGHSPFAGHCSVCRLQKRILYVCSVIPPYRVTDHHSS